MSPMQVQLQDDSVVELPDNATGIDLARHLRLTGPEQALGLLVNGKTYDLDHPLKDGDVVGFWSFSDPEGKEMFWHTSAHVLAQAVLRLYPDAQPTIGPPIENGFYYDFANLEISEHDLKGIEEEMRKIAKENYQSEREEFANKDEALTAFSDNKYKVEIIEAIEDDAGLTAYRQGEFYDLCRGPHLPSLGKIKALKLMKTAGAYWRGDSRNEMLTRIYGVSFPDRKLLKEYLKQLEEAKKRDHKVVGPRLGLFSLREEAPGMPFIHHHGMRVWKALMEFWTEMHNKAGYEEIKTPTMMTRELWERSGHWENYRENMFTSSIEDRDFAIKPMNCPGCMLYYKSTIHSYRELPLRIAEVGNVHRFEPSGAISGLFRVRSFHQDDAHIFMKPSDIENEILGVLSLTDAIYRQFGLEYHLELSTKPDKNTVGSDEDWEIATEGLRQALIKTGREFRVNEGDGAFYGPKIDMHIRDAIGRTWQCGTIQLDMALPEKFDLEYTASDGSRQRPIMIHRALYGSIERFFGILIEHYGGRFPLWMSPRHVCILTVADRHIEYAEELKKKIQAAGIYCDLDDGGESVSKKVRTAQLSQVNYILTIGDKELENRTIALRTRNNEVIGEVQVDDFISTICEEKDNRAQQSPYTRND